MHVFQNDCVVTYRIVVYVVSQKHYIRAGEIYG